MQIKNVIIVGAGPAGLATAIELKKISNFDVVVLEKNPEISYKICAGGIGPDSSEIGMPEEIIDRKFNKVKIFTSKQSLIIKENRPIAATTNRKTLHEIMAKEATKLGIKILFGKSVKERNNNSATTSSGEKFDFDYLVGADGSNSMIRKMMGVKTKKLLTASQYMIPQNYPDMEFYIDFEKFGLSYAWIFPQKNIVSVGTGYDSNLAKNWISVAEFRKNFDFWCKEKFNLENAKFEAFSINYDYRGFEFGNIFLVGDAAGLASGFTGEGIKFAILSGRDIAQKIINPNYKCKNIENILKIKKRGENFNRFLASNKIIGKTTIELCAFLMRTSIGKKIAGKVL